MSNWPAAIAWGLFGAIVVPALILGGSAVIGILVGNAIAPWAGAVAMIGCIAMTIWLLLGNGRIPRAVRPWVGLHP